jgi:hypothetical protein
MLPTRLPSAKGPRMPRGWRIATRIAAADLPPNRRLGALPPEQALPVYLRDKVTQDAPGWRVATRIGPRAGHRAYLPSDGRWAGPYPESRAVLAIR